VQFGPPGSTQGQVVTFQTDDPWQALAKASEAAGVNPNDAFAIAQATGTPPTDLISYLPALNAGFQANPGATTGQVAARTLGANPLQAATTDKVAAEKKGGTAAQSGLVSDIMGNIFEVLYPWVMFTLASVMTVAGLLVLLVALVKSPAGNLALGFAGPVGKGVGLVGKGLGK
jgi:hypothetical protein